MKNFNYLRGFDSFANQYRLNEMASNLMSIPEFKKRPELMRFIHTLSSEIVVSKSYNLSLPLGLRGSSQVIPFNKGRICITHECNFFHHPGEKKDAHYYHRFMIWDENWNLTRLSKPFKFMAAKIEFNTGLAIKDDNFIITYGYQDNAAYALKMPINLLDSLEWED